MAWTFLNYVCPVRFPPGTLSRTYHLHLAGRERRYACRSIACYLEMCALIIDTVDDGNSPIPDSPTGSNYGLARGDYQADRAGSDGKDPARQPPNSKRTSRE